MRLEIKENDKWYRVSSKKAINLVGFSEFEIVVTKIDGMMKYAIVGRYPLKRLCKSKERPSQATEIIKAFNDENDAITFFENMMEFVGIS